MSPRAYRQVARAHAVQDTEQQILDALRHLLGERWFEDITLDDIARAANTTRQTVIRRFGDKAGVLSAMADGLDAEIRARRWHNPGKTVAEIITVLVQDYEQAGDIVVRTLSQEARIPEFGAILARGRSSHRAWIEEMFAAWLGELPPASRAGRLAQLLAMTDVWVWHLLRRNQNHSASETSRLMIEAVERLLREDAVR